jgi:hypothetical protein
MAKARSQTGNIRIKKEEEDSKPTLILNGANNTRRSSRIEKRTPPVTNNRRLSAQQVNVKEETDTKSLLKLRSKPPKSASKQKISQAQINQLIDYIANRNMNVSEASRKADISLTSGSYYYNVYKNDPEKKIPLPRNQAPKIPTQEQIGNLIRYINNDKMTVKEASAKANLTYKSAYYYYNKYLEDPDHNIPIPRLQQGYTQDQKNEFIGYIVTDKMSLPAASKKVKMGLGAARHHYRKYFKQQNPNIPAPSHIVTLKRSPKQQLNEAINEAMGYIINDRMSIRAASIKANVCHSTTGKRYRQYLVDNNMKVPVVKIPTQYTQDQKNELLRYIVNDKMTVIAASEKANIHPVTSYKYYHQYLKDRNIYYPSQKVITQEQKSELIRYIADDKMSIKAASKKANMCGETGRKYCRQHLNDQTRDGSI